MTGKVFTTTWTTINHLITKYALEGLTWVSSVPTKCSTPIGMFLLGEILNSNVVHGGSVSLDLKLTGKRRLPYE